LADEGAGGTAAQGVSIDPAGMQNLGIRVVAAEMGNLSATLNVTGSIDFNQRDVAVIQARSGGFVSRVYARAPGDVVRAGAPIANVQLPEWGGAQTEFLAVRRLGRPDLTAAARQRLKLLGMSDGLIASVERSGRIRRLRMNSECQASSVITRVFSARLSSAPPTRSCT